MRVLFIHQNFPGQFRHVAQSLARRKGNEVVALTDAVNKQQLEGIKLARYGMPKNPPVGQISRAAGTLLNRFIRGEVVASGLVEMRKRGFVPDVIVGHPGWGELMLAKDIFPSTPLIAHAEYYYAAEGGDVGFDKEFPAVDDALRVLLKAKNIPLLAAMTDCTVGVAPTRWQASRFPQEVVGKIKTIHEGIRTDVVRPDPAATYQHGLDGRTLRAGDEVLSFVNRNLEPMRGFHIFMRALPAILAARPNAQAVIVGGDAVSYGPAPPGGSWKAKMLAEMQDRLPMDRVHFVGQIPYQAFISLMQVTRLHIYATYPFVLSWSALEAMAAGAVVLGSATPPVTEVIEHERTGLLYDFFDVDGLAKSAVNVLAHPEAFAAIRNAARRSVADRYDLSAVCLPAWQKLVVATARGDA
ncbi:MAG: glycosyltransferase [Hyphomicrobiaceae bacterium]